jgi:predicted transcriptional regulator
MELMVNILNQAGLSEIEASLYTYLRTNPGVSVAGACQAVKGSKSSVYRAYKRLQQLDMVIVKNEHWRLSIYAKPLKPLIEKLHSKIECQRNILAGLKSINRFFSQRLHGNL